MTCIVGLLTPDRTYLASDSCISTSYIKRQLRQPKIIRKIDRWMPDPADSTVCLIGTSGSPRVGQVIQHQFHMPTFNQKHHDIEFYMCGLFIPALREALSSEGLQGVDKDHSTARMDAEFIVAFPGRLFCVYSDFQVTEFADPYTVAGSGSEVALGALYASQDVQDPERRLTLAIEAAALYGPHVELPCRIEYLDNS